MLIENRIRRIKYTNRLNIKQREKTRFKKSGLSERVKETILPERNRKQLKSVIHSNSSDERTSI